MPWFKVDDRLPDNRKVRRAGTAAMGLWSLAGAWASGELTDGFVPKCIAIRWDSRGTLAAKLIAADLWTRAIRDGEPGYQFVNWSEHQPTKAEVDAERAAARERMKKRRAAKRSGEQAPNVPENDERSSGDVRGPRPDPIPTRPDPLVGYVDLEGSVSNARGVEPPPGNCSKHPGGTLLKCGPCGDARKEREAWEQRQAASRAKAKSDHARRQAEDRARAIDDCSMCDNHGYLGASVCGHDAEAIERNLQGAARARAVLAERRSADA